MTPKQKELVEVIESADDWVPILSLRQLFHARTIESVIEQELVLYKDGYVGARSLHFETLDTSTARLDELLEQPIGRSMADAARMMDQLEL